MLKIIATILAFSTCAFAETRYVYEYFSQIEPLVKNGRFDDAKTEFSKIKQTEVKHNSASGFFASLRYLGGDDQRNKGAFKYQEALRAALQNPDKCTPLGKYGIHCGISIMESDITQTPPEDMPFSPEFKEFIFNEYYKKNIEMYNQARLIINEREKREEQLEQNARIEKEEEQAVVRQLAQEKKELESKNEKELLAQEFKNVDIACKKAGYKGLAKHEDTSLDMISLIYLTQRDGGLEKYLNTVVGNLKNDKNSLCEIYRKVKVFQVLEDGVLYTYSEYDREGSFNLTVHVEKTEGTLYQEGQSLEDTFHVFTGMYTYITTVGAKKTIPSFRKAQIKLIVSPEKGSAGAFYLDS
jgi:hypothetical protein